ncbi:ATP-binding protein [Actinosynnema sp. NPDC020468]|uniref:ATP-binding protein n=1 Tax=Actinosynnema sp. NPDC020468 TaxID=3154488 RepID=UPI0033F82BEC
MTTQHRSGADRETTDVSRDLGTTSNREIRRLVGLLLADHGVVAEDAVLVVDELVSNARRHGTPPRRCRLLLHPGRRLRVEVEDSTSAHPRARTPDHTGGRGLLLVERLTAQWGVLHHAFHKTVWAEIALDRKAAHLAVVPTA